ncbi:MAG: response regulator [Oscillospiraceae bacterium]
MYRVMIVDDEDRIVEGLKQVLPWDKYNCEVVATASSGLEALDQIRKNPPDILFTDIRMPGMDGLALIAALRSEYPNMQVSILSGHPDFEYAQKAVQLGVSRYILKPSKMHELEEALAYMVEQRKLLGEVHPTAEEEEEGEDLPLSESGEHAQNFIVKNAIKYMEDHYAEKLTLPEVAEKTYVSQWHLSKLISRTTGHNFNDILNTVRITKAKELLEDPSLKIWEISERVGFTDATHFSRIFKKQEGISANEYRNQKIG